MSECHHLFNEAHWTLIKRKVIENLNGKLEWVFFRKELYFLMNALLVQVDLGFSLEIDEDIHD